MMLSVLGLVAATISPFGLPIANMGFILLLSFPVLFILGERVEMTRFISTTLGATRFRFAFAAVCASVGLFALSSIREFSGWSNLVFLSGSLLLLMTFLWVMSAENQIARPSLNLRSPLQRYVATHVRVAYFRGPIGILLAVAYSLSQYRLNLYDPFIHALAIGFVGTMILAHETVILAGLLGRRFREEKLTLIADAVLVFAASLRVYDELLLLAFRWAILRLAVVVSGWLVLAALLPLVPVIVMGTRNSP